jgi:hypothetical protein
MMAFLWLNGCHTGFSDPKMEQLLLPSMSPDDDREGTEPPEEQNPNPGVIAKA